MKTTKASISAIIIGIILCSISFSSCKSRNSQESADDLNYQTSTETTEKPKAKKPKAYLPISSVPVETAGAGFRYADVYVNLESEHSSDVYVDVNIYSGGKKVGSAFVTIEKGELQGYESSRLEGFYGVFEDRIPSTVTLKINKVTEGY